MALAAPPAGPDAEAVRWFERNRAACGPPGLFTEEYDITRTSTPGATLPQAFVHALMFESALGWPRLAGRGPHSCPTSLISPWTRAARQDKGTLHDPNRRHHRRQRRHRPRHGASCSGSEATTSVLLARGEAGLDGAVKDVEARRRRGARRSHRRRRLRRGRGGRPPGRGGTSGRSTSGSTSPSPRSSRRSGRSARGVPTGHRGQLPGLRLRHHGRADRMRPATPAPSCRSAPRSAYRGIPLQPRTAGPSTPSTASTRRCAPNCCTNRATSTSRWSRCRRSTRRSSLGAVPAARPPPTGPAHLPARGRGACRAVRRGPPERQEYWVGDSTAATLLANKFAPPCWTVTWAGPVTGPSKPRPAPSPERPNNLWAPVDGPRGHDYTAHGSFDDKAKSRSVQLWASQHHGVLGGALLGLAGAAAAATALGRKGRP